MKRNNKKKVEDSSGNEPGNKFNFKSLDEVFSSNARNPYKTNSKDSYENQIKKMNIADLQTHAISLGIKPSRNRTMLERNLISLFRRNTGNQFGVQSSENGVKDLNKVMEILSKGA